MKKYYKKSTDNKVTKWIIGGIILIGMLFIPIKGYSIFTRLKNLIIKPKAIQQ